MLEKRYEPSKVEEGKYEKWKQKGYFIAGKDKSKPAFSLVIPPPNVTGKLHLGHAMDTTLNSFNHPSFYIYQRTPLQLLYEH